MDSLEETLCSSSETYPPLEKYQLPHLHRDLSISKCCEQRQDAKVGGCRRFLDQIKLRQAWGQEALTKQGLVDT